MDKLHHVSTFFKNINNFLLDILFPTSCLRCRRENFWLCQACMHKIIINTEFFCPVCQTYSTPDGRICLACKRKSSLNALVPAANYLDPLVSRAVHLFKYRFAEDLHEPLGNLIVKSLQRTEIPIPDLVIPIPLHPRRLRWRGFNQASLLAKFVAENLLPLSTIPLNENALIRRRFTKPQMEITQRARRQQNVAGAFQVRCREPIQNKVILLIDDVSTTGSTIFECAEVLKTAGAKEIYAAVVAKQENR